MKEALLKSRVGLVVGAALAHNLALTAAPDAGGLTGGPGSWGQGAVIVGILFCAAVGLFVRRHEPGKHPGRGD